MAHRTSVAIVDGRIMLGAKAERAGGLIVHHHRPWWHRLMWYREVQRMGYCCDCIGLACRIFDAMAGQER